MKQCKYCKEDGFSWGNQGTEAEPKWRLGTYGDKGFVLHVCKKTDADAKERKAYWAKKRAMEKQAKKKAEETRYITLDDGSIIDTETGEIVEDKLPF